MKNKIVGLVWPCWENTFILNRFLERSSVRDRRSNFGHCLDTKHSKKKANNAFRAEKLHFASKLSPYQRLGCCQDESFGLGAKAFTGKFHLIVQIRILDYRLIIIILDLSCDPWECVCISWFIKLVNMPGPEGYAGES
ncbi:uncharacterized protein [Drosophila bipectinata]|uniref:uncharacterized protein isoform X2 n=1 Tax=Drosophila bipectinata TaxID=42026 RepID=UPI0038B2CB28